jgi:hypothetical protein
MTDEKELQDFSAVLDAYGGDPARWPAGSARRFAALLARSPDARRLQGEAVALDTLISRAEAAPSPLSTSARRTSLTDRIVAQATASARPADNVIQLPPRTRMPAAQAQRSIRHSPVWRAGALLAASLVAGLYIGGQGIGDDLLNSATETLGIGTLVDQAAYAMVDTGLPSIQDDAL